MGDSVEPHDEVDALLEAGLTRREALTLAATGALGLQQAMKPRRLGWFSRSATKPPIGVKFVPYPNSTPRIIPCAPGRKHFRIAAGDNLCAGCPNPPTYFDTELRGTIVTIEDPHNLFISPLPNYRHLISDLPGNSNRPGFEGRPLINCELYAVGCYPGQDTKPFLVPLHVGDTVVLRGQLVTDTQHGHTKRRGIYKVGFTHTEIHPYLPGSLAKINPADPPTTETHTFYAPLYPEWYLDTWPANKGSVAGDLVDNAIIRSTYGTIILSLPGPKPSPEAKMKLNITDVHATGSPPAIVATPYSATQMKVSVAMTGQNAYNSSVFRATFSPTWVTAQTPAMTVTYTPRTLPIDSLVQLIFTAKDTNGAALDGSLIFFNGTQVGVTGKPFNYIFKSYVTCDTDASPRSKPKCYREVPRVSVLITRPGFLDYHIYSLPLPYPPVNTATAIAQLKKPHRGLPVRSWLPIPRVRVTDP